MPLGLRGHLACQAKATVVRPLTCGQLAAARKGLCQCESDVVGLTGTDEEPYGTNPVGVVERDADQVVSGVLTIGPGPSLVEHDPGAGSSDGFDDLGVAVTKRSRRIARIDHPPSVGQLEPRAFAANDPRDGGLAGREAGGQQTRAGQLRTSPPNPHLSGATPSSRTHVSDRTASP